MKPNVGQTDRLIRFIFGTVLVLVGLFVSVSTALKVIFVLLGVVLVVTAALRFCPAYLPFKFNTLKK